MGSDAAPMITAELPAAELAAVLHAKGYTGVQLAMPPRHCGHCGFCPYHFEDQLEIRTAFAAQDGNFGAELLSGPVCP